MFFGFAGANFNGTRRHWAHGIFRLVVFFAPALFIVGVGGLLPTILCGGRVEGMFINATGERCMTQDAYRLEHDKAKRHTRCWRPLHVILTRHHISPPLLSHAAACLPIWRISFLFFVRITGVLSDGLGLLQSFSRYFSLTVFLRDS